MRVARTSDALHYTFNTSHICISYYAFLISVSNMFTFYLPPVCIRIERLTIEFLKCVLRIEVSAITAESCSKEGLIRLA